MRWLDKAELYAQTNCESPISLASPVTNYTSKYGLEKVRNKKTYYLVAICMLLAHPQQLFAAVYKLVDYSDGSPYAEGSPEYNYYGTVTTDGRLGSFTDLSVIIDWSVHLSTPGEKDGDTHEILTASNSTLTVNDIVTIDVQADSISIPLAVGTNSYLSFVGIESRDELRFTSPFRPVVPIVSVFGDKPGGAVILDTITPDHLEGILFPSDDRVSTIVAVLVPEPSTVILVIMLVSVCLPGRVWRRTEYH